MSKIKFKDLNIEDYSKNIKRFSKKVEELTFIEKALNIEGFEIMITKKG